ncbi:hypothetical protein ACOMHN_045162 [Nucella lapillus]
MTPSGFVLKSYPRASKGDCPVEWASYGEQCYLFQFYPTLPYDEASQACHQDGAILLSVNTEEENTFIANWLARYEGSRLSQWYTSGLELSGGVREWRGDGESLSAQDAYWIIDPATESQVAQNFSEAHLVYQYSGKENRFGWTWAGRTQALPYICEIQREEVYRILQKGRDFSYGSPSSDPSRWQVGPRFVYQSPSTVFVEQGSKVDSECVDQGSKIKCVDQESQVDIECIAKGNPSPTYTWYRNYGTQAQSVVSSSDRYIVTNGRLIITKPREKEDAGTYTCEAHNTAGTVFTSPIKVAAGRIEDFSNAKPGKRTAVLYQGAVLDCSPPAHYPAVVFQWMKEDRFLRPEMNPHTFLSENGKLYFSETQAADAADYHCMITLVALPGQRLATSQSQYRYSLGIPFRIEGEDANTFGPDIHDDFPAVFPKQPLKGQDMRLECLAYGRLPLYYSWSRVDGGELPSSRVSFSSLRRVLHVTDAQLQDTGVYRCTVQGRENVAVKNISVIVSAVPYFKYPLRTQHLDVGSRLTWVCDAVAIPRATYTWYRDGHTLATDPANDMQVEKNVLTISSADSSKHDGMYECMATNNIGSTASIAQIRVLSFQPNFEKRPAAREVMGAVGGNVSIPCRPEGAPHPSITWTRGDGATIASSGRAQITRSGSLVLSGLSRSDEGTYTCVAENTLGSAQTSAHLTVLKKTTLTRKPEATSVSENSTAHIQCEASFTANATDLVYAWYFNGKRLDFRLQPQYKIDNFNGVNGLYIIGAQFEHEGWYECRALTVYDSDRAQAFLAVMGPPGEPAGVHVHGQPVGTEVTLWWQRGQTHGDPVSLYTIHFSSNYDPTWRVLIEAIPAFETQVMEDANWRRHVIAARTLSPGTSYAFRVSAGSANFGFGPPSKPTALIKLNDAAPVYAVDAISGGGGKVGMLRVQWLPLAPERHGGSDLHYRVYYRKHGRPDDKWIDSGKISGDRPDRDGFLWYHAYVMEYNFYTGYQVKVQVINAMGPGPNSSAETVMSAEDIPITTPQNVNAEGLNATAGMVHWHLPNNTRNGIRGKVLGYQINWWHWGGRGENCDGFEKREVIRFIRHYGTDTQGVVIGLFANDNYWVNVQVFNTAGLSRPSGCNYLNTNYEAPLHYPEYTRVASHGPESVRVSWRGISTEQMESPVSGFKVWYWPYTEDIRTAKVAAFPKVFTGVLHGIEMDSIYKLRVLGTSDGGDGKKSPPIFFTLGGQVMFDQRTGEILASASLLKPSVSLLIAVSLLACLTWLEAATFP